jgi:cellulose synthase/poly-beta-1,6-N-acetylglucosamine synthase-like glycosyltransferase
MLIHALALTLSWLALSSVALLAFGRRVREASAPGSLAFVLAIEATGAVGALAAGMPRAEVIACVTASSLLGLLVVRLFPAWLPVGHAAWLFLAEVAALYLLVAAIVALFVPVGLPGQVVGLLLLAMQIAALIFLLSYTYELLDVVCRGRWRRPEACPPRIAARLTASDRARARPTDAKAMGWAPHVALHVPCHDEPPEIVERTIRALAALDFPRDAYQVFVVDNNTHDSAQWKPLAALCDDLGFTFLHLEDWPGYKSGALNYALAATPTDYELIGVIDADYLVEPSYLRELVPLFTDPHVGFVQTPQDYRDYRPDSTFYQRACYHAYRYFFDLSMPSRNERNAIIFGGTMGLIRADALRTIGGWDEWCITEDAEASLRLLMRGYEGRYVNRSYGRGLMPLEFDALKRQRFRWCFGGIQILRKHWPALLPWVRRARPARAWQAPGLTFAQRYHYLLGGLQWYGDVLTFGFTVVLLVTGWMRVLGHPLRLAVLSAPMLVVPITLWLTSLLRTMWGLRATRRCSRREALGAVAVLWSLSWVVTLACLQGLVRRRGVFLRTPKAGRAGLIRALRSTTIESFLAAACWTLGCSLLVVGLPQVRVPIGRDPSPGGLLATLTSTPWWLAGTSLASLCALAFLQGAAYVAAPTLCLLSLRSEKAAREVRRRAGETDAGEGVRERRLLTGALAAVATLAALLVGAGILPQTPAPANPARTKALSSLLGNANPVASPTATSVPLSPAPTAGATPLPTGATPTGLPTTSPHPGATPVPPTPPVPPRATPTPHPHP